MKALKVGELARRTGLTVRTLHHYDEIGLLSPSQRTPSGHRVYGEQDVERLQKIVSLRQVGLTLDQIRAWLEKPDVSALDVLDLHIGQLRTQMEAQAGLVMRLEAVARALRRDERVTMDEFLNTIGAINMFEKYYTKEELAQLEERRQQLGEDHIREVEQEWPRLIASVRTEMEKGTPPSDPHVQTLARRWMELVNEFTGGDARIARKVTQMYEQEPQMRERSGLDAALFDYVRRALSDE